MTTARTRWIWLACLLLLVSVALYSFDLQGRQLRYQGTPAAPTREKPNAGPKDAAKIVPGATSPAENVADSQPTSGAFPKPTYKAGTSYPADHEYNRTIVVARMANEDATWIDLHLGQDKLLSQAIYTVDHPGAPYIVPENKGHEAMVYLTYIIDFYDKLSDVTLFVHAHRFTWHNNDLLDSDMVKMVKALSSPKVVRDGYMNLRCHFDPGCPEHIHPNIDSSDINKPEEIIFGTTWKQIFPNEDIPDVLSQPCCAQVAVSRDRIHALPKSQYIFFRDWLLSTPFEDRLSGRVWEYVWQYIWTGQSEFCPKENVCYCEGYGICFGGEKQWAEYSTKHERSRDLEKLLAKLKEDKRQGHNVDGALAETEQELKDLRWFKERAKADAFERGRDPKNRAEEVGRRWKDGNGF